MGADVCSNIPDLSQNVPRRNIGTSFPSSQNVPRRKILSRSPSSTATGGGGVAMTAAVVRWPIQYHLLVKVLLVLRVLSLLHLLLGEAGCLVTCKTKWFTSVRTSFKINQHVNQWTHDGAD